MNLYYETRKLEDKNKIVLYLRIFGQVERDASLRIISIFEVATISHHTVESDDNGHGNVQNSEFSQKVSGGLH